MNEKCVCYFTSTVHVHVGNFAYLFIFCIDLLTSARSGHSSYARVIPLGKTSR